MRLWKVVGLAGLAGVAATGVVIARAERQRRAYTPDEVRARLHERIEVAPEEPSLVDGSERPSLVSRLRLRFGR
jgi:hypothetical protein